MKMGRWIGLLAAATLLAGCGNFWQAPSSSTTSFSLSNSGNITVTPGATSGNTATITVTPGSSFTGTVTLTCAVTAPTGATNAATCGLSSTSLSFSSSTSAQSSTLTATTTSTTTSGGYTITVTGVSGSVAETTTVCAVVGSGSCSSTASTSGHFYILNSSTLAGYTIGSGSMNLISNSSFTLTGASAIAISPSGNFLYVATNNGIIPFTINSSTGALTQGSAFGDTVAGALQVDPSGNWLIDASLAGTLNAYSLSSGAYGGTVQSESLNLGSGSLYPTGIAISPSGYSGADIVAVAMGTTGTGLFTFTSSTTSGPLSAEWSKILSPIGSGSDIAVAIDPQNRLLYVGETNAYTTSGYTGALRVYTIGSTGVTSLNAYAPAGTGPHAILPSKDGSYVYAASWGSDEITGYSVTTSALTAFGSTIATGTEPYGLVEDSTDGYVLGISYGGTPAFDAYTLSSGTLTSLTSNSTVSNPVAIVAVPK